jgi:DNA sulfur modification protein DndB
MMKLIPCIRGNIGTTEYYIATMKASEVVNSIRIPKEMPEWGNESVEERYQREINYKRVKEQIAPYLAIDPDRFFNALIIDILDGDAVTFDSLASVAKLPSLFSKLSDQFGILTLSGNERLVPLDGQHRLAAIKFALYGKDEKDQPIDSFAANPEIGNDDITLLLIRHDITKARKIFNKVNRYAKAASKADNLIINEDDYVAVVARDVANVVFKGLVNSKSNTIPSTSNDITTLSAIYEACLDYLTESPINPHRVSIDMLPDVATQNLWKSELKKMWVYLVRNISIFSDALSDIEPTGKDLRMELREEYILMKPIVQVALVGAIKKLMNSGMNMEAAIDKASRLDWRFECADWDRIAVDPGKRIISGTAARKFLSRVIAYRLGEDLGAKELEVLENQYRTLFDSADTSRRLPEKIA